MKLKFNKDAWYNGELLYKSGEIYEVSDELGFAQRWLKRGAEEVPPEINNTEIVKEIETPANMLEVESNNIESKPLRIRKKNQYREL